MKSKTPVITKCTLADVLPAQEYYYMLFDGTKYARQGTSKTNCGLLVCPNIEKAEEYRQKVARALPQFKTIKVSFETLKSMLSTCNAICLVDGLAVMVCQVSTDPKLRWKRPL